MVKGEKFSYDIDVDVENIKSPLPSRVPPSSDKSTTNNEEGSKTSYTKAMAGEALKTETETDNKEGGKNIGLEIEAKKEDRGKKKIGLIIGIVGAVVILVAGAIIMGRGGSLVKEKEVTINYWGLWEEEAVIGSVIADFEAEYPNIKVNYVKNFSDNYRSRLAGRLVKDPETIEVPDVFRLHASWLPMFRNNLEVVPKEIGEKIGLETDFYDVYKRDLKIDGTYRAIPLMYDGLALFYNKKLLSAGGVDLPKTWWDLESASKKLTVTDAEGKIKVAGVAMGMTENVDHWSDILGLMMKQSGVDLTKNNEVNNQKIASTLTFYSLFATKTKCWQASLPNSTELFASGNLAFYFAPSWRVFNIGEINPLLDYGITKVPQLPIMSDMTPEDLENVEDENLTKIAWSSYWVEGVNNKSKNKDEAFLFLEFLTRKENLTKMYESGSQIRAFGEISPRISMMAEMKANPKVAGFIEGAEMAYSGWTNSRTFDEGLNDRMSQYFKDAVNLMVLEGNSVDKVMPSLTSGISQIVNQYNLR